MFGIRDSWVGVYHQIFCGFVAAARQCQIDFANKIGQYIWAWFVAINWSVSNSTIVFNVAWSNITETAVGDSTTKALAAHRHIVLDQDQYGLILIEFLPLRLLDTRDHVRLREGSSENALRRTYGNEKCGILDQLEDQFKHQISYYNQKSRNKEQEWVSTDS